MHNTEEGLCNLSMKVRLLKSLRYLQQNIWGRLCLERWHQWNIFFFLDLKGFPMFSFTLCPAEISSASASSGAKMPHTQPKTGDTSQEAWCHYKHLQRPEVSALMCETGGGRRESRHRAPRGRREGNLKEAVNFTHPAGWSPSHCFSGLTLQRWLLSILT